MDTFLGTEKKVDQATLTKENSAVLQNFAEATHVSNFVCEEDLVREIELNRMTEKIEPSGLLDL